MNHFIQTLLYCLQFCVSYFLMLIFMTFNSWLCLAILLGITIGHFVFGVKQSKHDGRSGDDCDH
jgi:solute carrier family 31 (copper transporter), member 1